MYVPAVIDAIVNAATGDPVFAGLIVVLLLVVFLGFLFVRRTMANVREGFDEAYRGR